MKLKKPKRCERTAGHTCHRVIVRRKNVSDTTHALRKFCGTPCQVAQAKHELGMRFGKGTR